MPIQISTPSKPPENPGNLSRKIPEKPRTPYKLPQMTHLPELTAWRLFFRRLLRGFATLLLTLICRVKVTGLENFPSHGPALIVFNHLGDADIVVGLAYMPSYQIQTLTKIDLYVEYPPLGWLFNAYGVIWVHRGTADRRALRAAFQALHLGQYVAIAPEGRESLSGELEEGTGGAAYLAIKSGAGILPVGVTGTSNAQVYGKIKHFSRPEITMNVGELFHLGEHDLSREAIQCGTQEIMKRIADLIPLTFRGVYQ